MELIYLFARDSEDKPYSIVELAYNVKDALADLYADGTKTGIVIPRGLPKTKLWAIAKAILGFVPTKAHESPGRPKFKFDYEQIHKLASIMCTDEDIALVCGCSIDAVIRAKKQDPEFIEAYYKGKGNARVSLRRKQWVRAMGEVKPDFLIDELNKLIGGDKIKSDIVTAVNDLIEKAQLMKNKDKGHPGVMIFLGKNELGQSDQVALTHSSPVSLQDAMEQVKSHLKTNPGLREKMEDELKD